MKKFILGLLLTLIVSVPTWATPLVDYSQAPYSSSQKALNDLLKGKIEDPSTDALLSILSIGSEYMVRNPEFDMRDFERAYIYPYEKTNLRVVHFAILQYWAVKATLHKSWELLPKDFAESIQVLDGHLASIRQAKYIFSIMSLAFSEDERYITMVNNFNAKAML